MELSTLYPLSVQALDKYHWTPLAVAQRAAQWLACDAGVKVLDIGSGSGKFCLAAARDNPGAYFYGIEQRKWLVDYAEAARKKLGLKNVLFIHGNFTQLDLGRYDHFYFYNSFYENLAGTNKIDDELLYSAELYNYYSRYLLSQLHKKQQGTRLCTLCSGEDEIPPDFQLVGSDVGDLLKFWIKV
jgi:SAM-dependent methyltransferase